MKPKVAIITRTKNRVLLLHRAIESVLGQDFQDWMMLIVNDGGDKNELVNLVSRYEPQFKNRCQLIHNDTSVGMEAASNIGIKASDSNYVVIHDDDDSWHPSFLDKCVTFLETNPYPSVAGVITHSVRVLERIEGSTIIKGYTEPFNAWLNNITLFRIAASNVFPPISFVYKREVFTKTRYYREDLPVLGDWEFNLRFMRLFDIYVIPEELAFYHHRLEEKEGKYSNSVVKDDSKHKFYDTLIRNELLRHDLDHNSIGLGHLVNISKGFAEVHDHIWPIAICINKLRKIKWLRKIRRFFN